MKKRNREINIFNLSMMDVISGAMGAFLIIMVILSQYYESDPTANKNVDELEKDIKKAYEEVRDMREKLKYNDMGFEDLRERLLQTEKRLESAQRKVRDLREQLNEAKSQINRLKDEKQREIRRREKAEEETLKAQNQVKYKKGIIIEMRYEHNADIDLYSYNTSVNLDTGAMMPPFNPAPEQQWSYWVTSEILDDQFGPGRDIWFEAQAIQDMDYKIYYKLMDREPGVKTSPIQGVIFGPWAGDVINLPEIVLTTEKPWELVGLYQFEEDGKVTFREATEAEREKEREDLPALNEKYQAEKIEREKKAKHQKPQEVKEDEKPAGDEENKGGFFDLRKWLEDQKKQK